MIAAVTKLSPAQEVAEASEWWYISRNISRPYKSRIWTGPKSERDDPVPPTAAEVFSLLRLDLGQLEQIFDHHPEGTILLYQDLGGCSLDETEKWQVLSRLTGKIIHLVHYSDVEQSCSWTELGVYYPDGRVELKDRKNKKNN